MPSNETPTTANDGIYMPLDSSKNEIRILQLYPFQDRDGPIQCHVKNVLLDDISDFEALSYSWGDPTATKQILLNDREFNVTVSAWSALRELRSEHSPIFIWVDAICIDQTNLAERAEQVKVMGTIYRKAKTVKVWLGPEDDDAITVLKTMSSVHGVKDTIRLGKPAQERMDQIQKFFAKSWWERLWVVQEVALGQKVIFQEGSKTLDYEELSAAYRASEVFFNENLKGFNYGAYGSGAEKFMQIFESTRVLGQIRDICGVELTIGDEAQIRESTMTWMTVANLLRNRKATIGKDRLYALYGLLPEKVVQNPGMEPSYSISTEEAFTEVTYSIMESSQSLMMFNFMHRNQSPESVSLPSWVPDWRQAPSNKYEGNLRVTRENLYDASNGTPFYLRRLSSNTICLKGFFVDIVQTFQSASLFPSASPMLDGIYKLWRETWANTTPPDNAMMKKYLDGTTAETAFRRTMVWDCEVGDEEGSLKRMSQEEGMAMFKAHDLAVRIAFGDDEDVMGENLSAKDARRTNYMLNCAKDRAFFVTASQLIGMTQINVEAGDHIFVVAGNSHPVILRPSKKYADTWHAVGECYLHGFMDGAGVINAALCAQFEEMMFANPAIQNLKGTERNPRQDEIKEQPDGWWKWLLVE